MFENIHVSQLVVRRDGRLYRTLAGILGRDDPDTHLIVWPDDPRFFAANGELDPDGVYEIPPDEPGLGIGRVIDEEDRPSQSETLVLVLRVK